LAHADDAGVLGAGPDGTPLLALLGATSLLSVPISDGGTGYGVLTLARQAAEGRFEIAELGLAEELGEHLGVAIRVDRMFRHRSAVAEALQSSLLPARLPDVPGLDLSAAYVPAGEGLEVSGDFYDVFAISDGWAITVGDVCGKGQEAAAMTAATRHAIRAIAHWNPDPVDVLAKVNEVILAGDYEDRFVTAKLAYLRRDGTRVHVDLASSGHPGPAIVRPDGRVEVLSGAAAGNPRARPGRLALLLLRRRHRSPRRGDGFLRGPSGRRASRGGGPLRRRDDPADPGPGHQLLPGSATGRHDDRGREGDRSARRCLTGVTRRRRRRRPRWLPR
jgi:hypothetical protein